MITNSVVSNAANTFVALAPGQSASDPSDAIVKNSSLKPIEPINASAKVAVQLQGGPTAQAADNDDSVIVSLSDMGKAAEQKERAAANDSVQQGAAAQQESAAAAKAQREKREQIEIQQVVSELSSRDREVRAHEQAHAAVGGQYAGAPSYQFKRGPDGVNYAVGGEVQIDVSPAPSPQETIAKAQVVRQAALAPAEPSPQDRRVAAQASQMEAQARAEMAQENANKIEQSGSSDALEEQGAETVPADGLADSVIRAEAGAEVNGASTRQSAFDREAASRTSTISSLAANVVGEQMNRVISSVAGEARRPGELLSQMV